MGLYVADKLDKDRMLNIAEYSGDDIELLCGYTKCTYIVHYGTSYKPDSVTGSLEQVDINPEDAITGIKRILTTKYVIPGHNITVYTNATLTDTAVSDLVFYAIPILIILMLIAGRRIDIMLSNLTESKIRAIKERHALESDIKITIASTAFHEMNTPLTVIKDIITNLSNKYGVCVDGCVSSIATDETEQIFGLLNSNIERLESVLSQMTANSKLESKNASLYTIIESTLSSLHVIYTEANFDYNITAKELLTSVSPEKLCNGTLANIFNNLFTNSLEAGSNDIAVYAKKSKKEDFVTIIVRDNGSGIKGINEDNFDDIFDLGVSTKTSGINSEPINPVKATELLENTGEFSRGNGLFLVRTVLESSGGSITLIDTSTSGTIFELIIPVKEYVNGR